METAELKLNVTALVSLLQCAGFSLNHSEHKYESMPEQKEKCISIEITCNKSNMKYVMSKMAIPQKVVATPVDNNAEFINLQQELNNAEHPPPPNPPTPKISDPNMKLIQEKFREIIDLLSPTDINQNVTVKSDSSVSTTSFRTNPNWDVDLSTSPPQRTSSPLPTLRKTSHSAKLHLSGSGKTLTSVLQDIRKLMDVAIDLNATAIGPNTTFTMPEISCDTAASVNVDSSHSSQMSERSEKVHRRISNIKMSPMVDRKSLPSLGAFINMNINSKTAQPVKKTAVTPKARADNQTALTGEKKTFSKLPSKIGTLKRSHSITSNKQLKFPAVEVRVDTPRPLTVNSKTKSVTNITGTRSPLSTRMRTPLSTTNKSISRLISNLKK